MCYTSDITLFLYQLAQARPHNVLHFLVVNTICFDQKNFFSGLKLNVTVNNAP